MDGPSGLCGLRVLRTDKAVFMTAHGLGSRQGVLTAYLDEGKKRCDSKRSSVLLFSYFQCKSKELLFSHTKVLQIFPETK